MTNNRIMVVEDEAIAGQTLIQKLTEKGYDAHGPMRTGEQAIAQAEALQPDLILMDIQLAGEMDGIDAAGQIRAHLDIPVVFLTAFSDDNILARAKLTTPHSYLIKPVRDRELFVTVELTLERSRLERELKQRADDLHKARQEWERTFESVRDLIAIVGVDRKIIRGNKALAERLGIAAEKLPGLNFCKALTGDGQLSGEFPLERFIKEGIEQTGEIQVPNLEGVFLMTVTPLRDADGSTVGVVCNCHDITVRKLAEEKLKKLKEEQEAFGRAMVSREARLVSMITEIKDEARRLQGIVESGFGTPQAADGNEREVDCRSPQPVAG